MNFSISYEDEDCVEDSNYTLYWTEPKSFRDDIIQAVFSRTIEEITNLCEFYCYCNYDDDYDKEKIGINRFSHCFKIETNTPEDYYLYVCSRIKNLKLEDFMESYWFYYNDNDIWSSELEMAKQQRRAFIENIREELIQVTMHPKRLIRHLELGGEIDDF